MYTYLEKRDDDDEVIEISKEILDQYIYNIECPKESQSTFSMERKFYSTLI